MHHSKKVADAKKIELQDRFEALLPQISKELFNRYLKVKAESGILKAVDLVLEELEKAKRS